MGAPTSPPVSRVVMSHAIPKFTEQTDKESHAWSLVLRMLSKIMTP